MNTQDHAQDALLQEERDAYIAKVERLRSDVEDFSNNVLGAAKISVDIAKRKLTKVLEQVNRDDAYKPMGKPMLDEYSAMNRGLRESSGVLETAYGLLADSLGLEKLIEKIKELDDEN